MTYRIQSGPTLCARGGMVCRTMDIGMGEEGAWGAMANRLLPTPTLTWGCQLELEELRQTLLGCNLKFVAGWAYFIHNERASSGWREKTQHYSEDHGLGRAVMQTQQ